MKVTQTIFSQLYRRYACTYKPRLKPAGAQGPILDRGRPLVNKYKHSPVHRSSIPNTSII